MSHDQELKKPFLVKKYLKCTISFQGFGGAKKRGVYRQKIALGGGGWCFLFFIFFI